MLTYIKEHHTTTPFSALEAYAANHLLAAGFDKVDYVSIADSETLQPALNLTGEHKLVALIAAFLGDVRLIDNAELSN